MWLRLSDPSQAKLLPTLDPDYRAAKYSCLIDLSIVQDLLPLGIVSNFMSYQYYIQYGENTMIQILVPPADKEYLPVRIQTWNYSTDTYTEEYIFNHIKKYRMTSDSISFSIEESMGLVKNLCDTNNLSGRSDSVMIISQSSNEEYQILFNDSLDNIMSRGLFYPNIQCLPSKVIRNDPQNTTRILEELIYGKAAIDSLIQFYNHEGYEPIGDEEWFSAEDQLPDEVKEMNKRIIERYQEKKE